MTYLSLEFFFAFLIFLSAYWAIAFSPRAQNGLLLLASYAIIASFNWMSLALIIIYSLAVQILANWLHLYPAKKINNYLIILCVGALLFTFKYYNFFISEFEESLSLLQLKFEFNLLKLILPIGISFYTFHSVSYLVSIKKQELKPFPLFDLLLYLAFFPSVVAGPINRAKNFIGQIQTREIRILKKEDLRKAFLLIALAIAKLLLLSSFLAERFANPVFTSPSLYSPVEILTGVYAYAFQIYCNFSGYTDLVTAIALLLGFHLPKNFNAPYLAHNLSDFWQRWHISLSTFIRDYIYIPLGGNKGTFLRVQINLAIAMILSGLWHGAGFNFIVWGALHAAGLIICNIAKRYFPLLGEMFNRFYISRFLTFHFICFTWIFFRSENLSDALYILNAIHALSTHSLGSSIIALSFIASFMLYPQFISLLHLGKNALLKAPILIWIISISFLIYSIILLSPAGVPEFIYARF